MATWINIQNPEDLQTAKAGAVVDALKSAALAAGQTDPSDDVIANVCARIRSEIQSGRVIRVSATPAAIPPSLKSLALRLILWELQSRLNSLGGTFEPNEQEKTDHKDDLRYLERIAGGAVTVEIADDPEPTPDVQSGGLIETAQEGNSGNSREELMRL